MRRSSSSTAELTCFFTEYVVKYASADAADEAGDNGEDDDEMSSVGSWGSEDEEPAGQMDI